MTQSLTQFKNTNSLSEEPICIKSAYGYLKLSKRSTYFINETTFIYLAGTSLLLYNYETFKQKIIYFKIKGFIQSICISPTKNNALIVDIDQKNTYILQIDLKSDELSSNKTTKTKLIKDTSICCMAVSDNQEFIVCQSGASSNWNLFVFSFLKLNLLGETKTITNSHNEQTVEEISFLPSENKRFILIGHKLIKIFYHANKMIKLIFNIECNIFLEYHSWLSKNEVICVDKLGCCYLIEPKQNIVRNIKFVNIEDSKIITNNRSET
jgi:hypothetical protein